MRRKPIVITSVIGLVVIVVVTIFLFRSVDQHADEKAAWEKRAADKLQQNADDWVRKARDAAAKSELKGSTGETSGTVDSNR